MGRRTRDAEAELNLPPGFRFHPTDEELVIHYLCRKAACQCIPVPIIAEVDLYKFDPWELPEKALFGQREWYFFTPRDRKYPNGSRPNRAAGRGYWKATGADKPVTPAAGRKPLGIKKALVFYSGKAPRGVKTDWIMHEYRLADANRSAAKKGGSLRAKIEMWESIILTLIATAGNNIGKVLQKKGTVILPPVSFKLKVVRAYAFNKLWISGFLMDIFGALLMLRALSLAPVSVIQPVSGCGLAILSVFSHFYLKEMMNAMDWIGIALAGFGTIGVGIGGEEQTVPALSLFRLPWLVISVSILFAFLNAWIRIYKSQRREQELMQSDVVEEIMFGLESGVLFGMSSVISKMGFVFSEQGFSKILVPVCISISICCSGTGFIYQTRGLKHGRAIVVSTCAAVASIVTGVLAGMLALGEKLPSAPLARFLLFLGWFFIIVGVILLVGSTRVISLLPSRLRRILKISHERNQNLRRSASLRAKEAAGPSTVIHTSTLHHLIALPAKEKP